MVIMVLESKSWLVDSLRYPSNGHAQARVNAVIVPNECHLISRTMLLSIVTSFEQEHIIMIKRSSEILIKQLPAISNKFEAMIDINFSNATTEWCASVLFQKTRGNNVLSWALSDCASSSMRDLGRTSAVSMNIHCTINAPVVYRPYRIRKASAQSYCKWAVRIKCREEIEFAIASSVMLVKKSSGEYRICVDFRKLNAV